MTHSNPTASLTTNPIEQTAEISTLDIVRTRLRESADSLRFQTACTAYQLELARDIAVLSLSNPHDASWFRSEEIQEEEEAE